jgi:hypothetical protein
MRLEARQQTRFAARIDLIPSHVRHARIGGKASHRACIQAQTAGFRRFFTALEQRLQSETDAKEWHTGEDALDQPVAHLHFVKRPHHLAEVAHAWQNNLARIAQTGSVAHQRVSRANFGERVLDRTQIAGAVI